MKVSTLQAGFYLLGIFLNVLALLYSIDTGQPLYAVVFASVVVYLIYRYRTRGRFDAEEAASEEPTDGN